MKTGYLLVVDLKPAIDKAAAQLKIWPEVVAAIIAHESKAMERRTAEHVGQNTLGNGFGLVPSRRPQFPGMYADAAERIQAKLKGDSASIGIGQMRVGWAKYLRSKFPDIQKRESVVDDLLTPVVAVGYVAAGLRDLFNKLEAFLARNNASLNQIERMELVALGYNIGWDNLESRNLMDGGMGHDIATRVAAIRKQSKYISIIRQWLRSLNPQPTISAAN
jgi:hypothetical protein